MSVIKQSRKEWFYDQFSHWPIHAALAFLTWGILVFCGIVAGRFFDGFPLGGVVFASLITVLVSIFFLEFGQAQIKNGYQPLDLYDLYDALADWVSWAWGPLLLTGIILVLT